MSQLAKAAAVLGCGVAGGFLGWLVALLTAPWDIEDGLMYFVVLMPGGAAAGVAVGVVVFT